MTAIAPVQSTSSAALRPVQFHLDPHRIYDHVRRETPQYNQDKVVFTSRVANPFGPHIPASAFNIPPMEAPRPTVPVSAPKASHPATDTPRVSVTERLRNSFGKYWSGQKTAAAGLGQTIAGVGRATLHAPMASLELMGRSAVAMSGGQVTYAGATPVDRMGAGLSDTGRGLTTLAQGSAQAMLGSLELTGYAAAAGVAVTAKGAGMAAGAVAVATRGMGGTLKDTFVGEQFLSGFQLVAGK